MHGQQLHADIFSESKSILILYVKYFVHILSFLWHYQSIRKGLTESWKVQHFEEAEKSLEELK